MTNQNKDTQDTVYKLGMNLNPATWRNFRIDFISSVLFALFNVVFNQFYGPMAIRHGATNVEVGLLAAAPAIGLFLSPLWAGIMGHQSPRPWVLWPLSVGRTSLVLVGLFLSPWMFVAMSFFINFMNGMQAPAYPALLTRMYPPRLRGRLMGYVRVAQGFFLIPLAYLVGRWIDASGDLWPLIMAAITGTLSVVVFYHVAEVEPVPDIQVSRPNPQLESSWRARFHEQWLLIKENRALGLFLAATSATGFGNLLAGPLYQIYQVHTLNLSNGQIGITRVFYFLALLVAYFVLGLIIDKYSPKHAMLLGMAAYTITPILYAVAGTFAGVIISSSCLGIGDAAWDIGLMAYVFKVSPGREAPAFGLHYLLFGIRGTVAPILSTAATQIMSLQFVFWIACFICSVGLVLFALPARSRSSASTGFQA